MRQLLGVENSIWWEIGVSTHFVLCIVDALPMPCHVDGTRVEVEVHQVGYDARLQVPMDLVDYDLLINTCANTFFPMFIILTYLIPSSSSTV
jgi:hypothetical protein